VALRSVVVEAPPSPPAPRRTVVLRAGAPAPKGRWVDVLVGVLGALLLLAAVALAVVLPDKTYLNPQFRVAFVEGGGEFDGSQDHYFADAGETEYDFDVEVGQDNVKAITLDYGFADDAPYSLPDAFELWLYAPNGTLMGHVDSIANPPPRNGHNTTDPPITDIAHGPSTFLTAPAPSEQIVTGLTHTETEEQVQARLAPQHFVATKGTWKVHVKLIAAGDCPQPGAEGSFQSQAAVCRTGFPTPTGLGDFAGGVNQGDDPGNLFRLSAFSWTFYQVSVQELK